MTGPDIVEIGDTTSQAPGVTEDLAQHEHHDRRWLILPVL